MHISDISRMKTFDSLTRLGQLRRIRRLAETALQAYDLTNPRLTFLRYFANITYRVEVPDLLLKTINPGPYLPNRCLLRVLASDHWEYAKGEMTWLAALSDVAGLPVPAPVPTREGKLLTRVTTPSIPNGRIVSVMRWVDGRRLTTGFQPQHFSAWGRMVGKLHAFAAGWKPPEGFERFIWDWEGLLGGRNFGCSIEELVDFMPVPLQEPFRVVSADARTVMEALGKKPDTYGMVHGDMCPANIIFKDGDVVPIDFEDCGFGYWLWDIGVALSLDPWTEIWCRQRDAFLDGYTRIHPLPDSQLRHLDLFVAMDLATAALWGTLFIREDLANKAEYQSWRDEKGFLLLRYLAQH
jgi:Ser/Thr protein kinase RdoA (MazF antagonist)